ncbi:hypothetical protein LPJ63_001055 [Coemansia sp. RSA 2711]|nr:hypothetical protein LPJ63_001055 [Coemansia sp. RSA 2711]KAJ2316811.1 hypothetical protein IWW52_003446 [Coemansia sp. RSA 2704]KAJ2730325.1 hypothetical protein H4R23_003362 [Coemansia sp. Cherry 401B]
MEHQMANTAVPTTLNKTILDLLPVFEVTAKRQLRQLQAGTPRVLNECFSDSISAQSVVMGCEGSNSHKLAAPTAGYGLDSGKASLCSDSGAGHSYVSDTSVLTGNCGAVELPTWRRLKRTPSPCRMARAIETPPPAILRYYGDSATPPLARMPSDRWEATPESADVNIGAVVYRARSTRSLDVTPGRDTPGAWAAHSQPDIGRRASADGEGLGSCPICLEEFDCGDHLRELPCLHRYHLMCIDTWLVSRSTCCPYCKMDIRRWYYGPDFDDSIPHVRPDTHPDLTPHAAPRTLHRIEGYHSGHSSLSRAWRALRSALN